MKEFSMHDFFLHCLQCIMHALRWSWGVTEIFLFFLYKYILVKKEQFQAYYKAQEWEM